MTPSLTDCPECKDGQKRYERPEPWVARDTPPSLEEYYDTCDRCDGSGEIPVDEIGF